MNGKAIRPPWPSGGRNIAGSKPKPSTKFMVCDRLRARRMGRAALRKPGMSACCFSCKLVRASQWMPVSPTDHAKSAHLGTWRMAHAGPSTTASRTVSAEPATQASIACTSQFLSVIICRTSGIGHLARSSAGSSANALQHTSFHRSSTFIAQPHACWYLRWAVSEAAGEADWSSSNHLWPKLRWSRYGSIAWNPPRSSSSSGSVAPATR
mmetsp:Transcript_59756/g.182531  ORF Transcript_59756/g.182531 Transcript_59756/m.182531 type:complete len:210 (+) Transcript_59756:385-1014(+)